MKIISDTSLKLFKLYKFLGHHCTRFSRKTPASYTGVLLNPICFRLSRNNEISEAAVKIPKAAAAWIVKIFVLKNLLTIFKQQNCEVSSNNAVSCNSCDNMHKLMEQQQPTYETTHSSLVTSILFTLC